MKQGMGISFYWGKTRHMKIHFPAIDCSWETSLYGISIKDTFVGIMVRGKRIVQTRDDSHWDIDRLRAEGAYDHGRDGWK